MQNDNPMSQDELVSRIQALTASVRADNNPEELEKIRKLIKKNVPFTLRGYFMAADAAPAREEKKSTVREKSEAPAKREPRPIPADAKTLYINLGKMGHVYARDLVSLITADGEISRDDIYQIRLHDKYSFSPRQVFVRDDERGRLSQDDREAPGPGPQKQDHPGELLQQGQEGRRPER